MAYRRRSATAASISDGFTLSPLPWPVLLILGLVMVFLGTSWFFSYESAVETAEEQMGWILLVTPLVLILLAKWLSSFENPESFLGWDHRQRSYRRPPSEGSSPWGVAAVIVLLLVLVQFQSSILESWFV